MKIHNINEHALDFIDTEDKAYFLGFFYADGYNMKDGRGFSIGVHPKDSEILEKLKVVLGYTGHIYHYPGYRPGDNGISRLSIKNRYLSNKLAELGAPNNKTECLSFPKPYIIPDGLVRHFVRGYFDGDGSITRSGVSPYYTPQLKIIGTHHFLVGLLKHLREATLQKGEIYTLPQSQKCNVLIISGQHALVSGAWLYKDAHIFLTRKKSRYQELFNASSSKLRYSAQALIRQFGYSLWNMDE